MTDKEKCKYCINGNENGDCIAKQEAPFGAFVCNNGEMFEYVEFDTFVDVEKIGVGGVIVHRKNKEKVMSVLNERKIEGEKNEVI